jgi:hypothetical protein
MIFTKFIVTVLLLSMDAAAAFGRRTPQDFEERKAKEANVEKKKKSLRSPSTNNVEHIIAESRIVGGEDASPGEYPFFVQGDGCGASLIWPDVVLTAAHCAGAFDERVTIGAYRYDTTEAGAEFRTTSTQIDHPSYNSQTSAYDFRLVKLTQPSTKQVVGLNEFASNPSNNEPLTVIGFGATSEGGSGSEILQEVTVPYVDHNTCNNLYGGQIQENNMLCAGLVNQGGKDSCQGDSGGPIMDSTGNYQVGVVSWGSGCAQPDSPGVYSRVSGAIDWINGQICALSANPPPSCGGGSGSGGASPVPTASPMSSGSGSGSSGGSAGSNQIDIVITYDDYPEETGWVLKDANGNTVDSREAESVSEQSATIEYTVDNLAAGTYTLEVTDTYGDGICCEHGNGSFKVLVDGQNVASSNGQFDETTSVTFTIGSTSGGGSGGSGGASPTSSPVVEFLVDIQYDNWPDEFSWSIVRQDSGTPVITIPTNYARAGEFVRIPVSLTPGESYVLQLRDTYGDGLYGYVDVYAVVNGDDLPALVYSNGDFGGSDDLLFSVPADLGTDRRKRAGNKARKSKNHKKSETCSDTDGTFLVNDDMGEKGCNWLSSNLSRVQDLCELLDVAVVCPSTCNVCDLF